MPWGEEECPECEGVWTCEDLANITLEVMYEYDSNQDG